MPKVIGGDVRREGISGEKTLNKDGTTVKRFSLVYQVLADDVGQTEDDILATPTLPKLGDQIRGATCKRVSAQESNTAALLWEVTCEFDSSVQEDEEEEDPEDVRPKWSWSYETVEEALQYDAIEGQEKPIQNSIKEPIPVTAPFAIFILTVERYERSFDADTLFRYGNRVNKTAFWGAPKGTALMAGIDDQEATVNGQDVRRVRYVIKFYLKEDENGQIMEDSWQLKLRDHGTKWQEEITVVIDGEEQERPLNAFMDQEGNPVTGDLDGKGNKLEEGADPVYLDFARFGEADFNALQLGPFT